MGRGFGVAERLRGGRQGLCPCTPVGELGVVGGLVGGGEWVGGGPWDSYPMALWGGEAILGWGDVAAGVRG